MMRIRLLALSVVTSAVATLVSGSIASAQTFEPGNIVSDSIFTNNTTMSADAIQNFIRIKNVNCVNGEAACLRNFTENGKSAGTIIKEAADLYRINPQALLVLLQKETALVTISQPGSWRYRTATGYGCPDTAACDSQYYGFTNQVHKAARMFRFIMDDNPGWYTPYELGVNYIQYNPNGNCGGTNVNIQNRATQALYNYTPYQPNAAALAAGFGSGDSCSAYGNRNFWLYFNTWFGSTQGSLLLQSPQSPAVYLQSGGTRYGIPSWDVINAYGLGNIAVTPVSDQYMNGLTDGGVLGTTFKREGSDAVYFADNGHRFGFATYQQCINWGFPGCLTSASKSLAPPIFDRLYDVGAMKPLMLTGSSVFLMQDGEKLPFASGKAMNDRGYSNADIVPVTNPVNNRQPVGFALLEDRTFVKFSPQATIYYYDAGDFYSLSYQAFRTLAANKPVYVDGYSKYTLAAPTAEYLVSSLVQTSDGRSYLMSESKKYDLTSVAGEWPTRQAISELDAAMAAQPSTTITDQSTFRSTSGMIFSVEDSKVRPFYSLSDYFAKHTNPINVGDDVPSLLTAGDYLISPGIGSVYQVSTPSKEYAIYALSSDNSVCQVNSLGQLGEFRLNTSATKRINEPAGSIKQLSKLVNSASGSISIVEAGKRTEFTRNDLLAHWGISPVPTSCTFEDSLIRSIPASPQTASRFMRADNGVIYYGQGGQKRPIYSYAAFLRLGGNGTNTPTVPQALLNQAPTGPAISE